jgi:hypothetical protein
MKKSSILLVLAGLVSVGSAQAAPVENAKPYDALYEQTTPVSKGTMRQICDGKGHMRTETNMNGQKSVTIMDFPNKTTIMLIEAQKMFMKSPMSPETEKSFQNTQPPSSKSLGSKVVSSHPCHGWQTKNGNFETLTWVGDDIHNLVHSETTTPQGKVITDLKSYSSKAPAEDLTAIPTGYKEMKVPGRN